MFHVEEAAPGPRVYLRPKESVHIPLKYQSFLCNHITSVQVKFRSEGDFEWTVMISLFFPPYLLFYSITFKEILFQFF